MRKWRRYGGVARLINNCWRLTMKLTLILIRGLKMVVLHLPATKPRATPLPLVMGKLRTQGAGRVSLTISNGLRFGYPLSFLLLLLALPVSAQNTITFTAEVTSGVETVIPVLTWDTSPLADSCFASGDWSGSKGPAGTETLPAISGSATYNIECEWVSSSALLTWTAPTQNTDGTPYTDPKGFKLYYDQTQGGPYENIIDLQDPNATTHIVSPLIPGTWFFTSTAYNQLDVESDKSNEASKIVGTDSETESVGITVNPKPASPVNLTVQ